MYDFIDGGRRWGAKMNEMKDGAWSTKWQRRGWVDARCLMMFGVGVFLSHRLLRVLVRVQVRAAKKGSGSEMKNYNLYKYGC